MRTRPDYPPIIIHDGQISFERCELGAWFRHHIRLCLGSAHRVMGLDFPPHPRRPAPHTTHTRTWRACSIQSTHSSQVHYARFHVDTTMPPALNARTHDARDGPRADAASGGALSRQRCQSHGRQAPRRRRRDRGEIARGPTTRSQRDRARGRVRLGEGCVGRWCRRRSRASAADRSLPPRTARERPACASRVGELRVCRPLPRSRL